jgi:D-3-phosphoglycerate dehydrogenase
MIKQTDLFKKLYANYNFNITIPDFTQVMSEDQLCNIIGNYDGWIIGDDPATRKVFECGINGKLKACVKWGVGVDNVDLKACKDLNIPITNIPGVFGEEVSDVAIGMLLNLTRRLHEIDAETKTGGWIKPCGVSLSGKKVSLIGFGDIGRCTARKLLAFNLNVNVSDPGFKKTDGRIICKYNNDLKIEECLHKINICSNIEESLTNSDFIIVTCALNKHTYHLINKEMVLLANKGVRIINVARGPVVKEDDIVELLESQYISSVGFDVFEVEPLSLKSKLRNYPQNFYGSHNGSNTIEGVIRTSERALQYLAEFLL